MKPEDAARRETDEWIAADMKAVSVVAKMLSPTYQSMIRDASTAYEAWETLRGFFVKQTLPDCVQLRKQLHEFTLGAGASQRKFDDMCSRLAAVGETMSEDEKLVILLGSLPPMVKLTVVLYVPQLGRKLVSVPALTAHRVLVQFERDRATLTVDGEIADVILRSGKLFAWHVEQLEKARAAQAADDSKHGGDNMIWHARLGHVSASKMFGMTKMCDGLPSLAR
ncbi:unnamed protein product [Phytophthora fragariaefolia]|uniref:Unnamed protein product n=1 Tax=Phytophthora fragariaefolia TaxID=1490495 RepID=A0A9W6TS81_9STRA|nr:unnamed protein product [Phytophthora fragariaefolia]